MKSQLENSFLFFFCGRNSSFIRRCVFVELCHRMIKSCLFLVRICSLAELDSVWWVLRLKRQTVSSHMKLKLLCSKYANYLTQFVYICRVKIISLWEIKNRLLKLFFYRCWSPIGKPIGSTNLFTLPVSDNVPTEQSGTEKAERFHFSDGIPQVKNRKDRSVYTI